MKNKFFLCIRPTVAEPVEVGEERRYLVESKERCYDKKISTVTERSYAGCSRRENMKAHGGGGGHRRRQRGVVGGDNGSSHKTLSQAIKAVLFEVSLRKSVRERQLRELMPRSISQTNIHLVGSKNEPVLSQAEIRQHQQQPQPISRTPSISSSNSLNSTKVISDNSSLNNGMYLVLITLFVTIFWGNIFAIFCTTIWMLYVGTHRSNESGRRSERCLVKLPETEEETVEYKKRVIVRKES